LEEFQISKCIKNNPCLFLFSIHFFLYKFHSLKNIKVNISPRISDTHTTGKTLGKTTLASAKYSYRIR